MREVVELAVKQVMVSDLTGSEGDPSEFVKFIIRSGPGIEKPVFFDAKPDEIGDIDAAKDIFVVEVNGSQVVCTLKELASKLKLSEGQTLETLLDNAAFLRGRRPGTR